MTPDAQEHRLTGSPGPAPRVGPLDDLPRLSRLEARLAGRLGPGGPRGAADLAAALGALIGGTLVADRFEVLARAASLKRPGVVVHLAWPRLGTRLALGVDPPLAHALVDCLLGYQRTAAEARLQVSPVEWGILGFVAASRLDHFGRADGLLGPWDLTIDRVGPDSFDLAGLGPIQTWRWRVVVGATVGTVRLWLPESLVLAWLAADGPGLPPASAGPCRLDGGWSRFADLASEWRVEAGRSTVPAAEFAALVAPGRLLLLDDGPLGGTVASPAGAVSLVQAGATWRGDYQARVDPGSAGDRVVVTSYLRSQPFPRSPPMADPDAAGRGITTTDQPAAASGPGDVSVTLTVELGRVNLPLARLAGLQPGEVLELARHSREPVDLSSNGRLVARGELVQVDTELGVRISQVFF